MLALNLYTSPSNNGGIVLYLDVDLGHMYDYLSVLMEEIGTTITYFDEENYH